MDSVFHALVPKALLGTGPNHFLMVGPVVDIWWGHSEMKTCC